MQFRPSRTASFSRRRTPTSKLGVRVDPHHDHSRQRAGAAQVSCCTALTIDHTEPSSIAAKPASSPGVLRHLRRFYSVTSLEAMTVFVRRSEHGLSDGMWYALEGLPCMVESNDASAFCVRFGLSQEDLDALLSSQATRSRPSRLSSNATFSSSAREVRPKCTKMILA